MAEPEWRSERDLERHFRLHRRLLRVLTIAEYDESARDTIEGGVRFDYRDPDTGEWRIGYYDRASQRFTAVSDDGFEIVTHFRCPERYVERLPGSSFA